MKLRLLILTALIIISLSRCKNEIPKTVASNPPETQEINDQSIEIKRSFPTVKNLSEYKKTEFLPTLEHPLSKNKNSIYCSTLLYCWDSIRTTIGNNIIIDKSLNDLILLNNSRSFIGVLKRDEYSIDAELYSGKIKVKSKFFKSLPFESNLESYPNRLKFGKTKVESFGYEGLHYKYAPVKNIRILYYLSDNNFIISLIPKNSKHEIILFKSEKSFNSMAEMYAEIEMNVKIGKMEESNIQLKWKYQIGEEDLILIPTVNFNIETNYDKLEGCYFNTNNIPWKIDTAKQRIAFYLNEAGAEVESEAIMICETPTFERSKDIKPKPKKLIFDNPFFIILKRTDGKNPYFALRIVNTELMKMD